MNRRCTPIIHDYFISVHLRVSAVIISIYRTGIITGLEVTPPIAILSGCIPASASAGTTTLI
jgi:hypothetical protein